MLINTKTKTFTQNLYYFAVVFHNLHFTKEATNHIRVMSSICISALHAMTTDISITPDQENRALLFYHAQFYETLPSLYVPKDPIHFSRFHKLSQDLQL